MRVRMVILALAPVVLAALPFVGLWYWHYGDFQPHTSPDMIYWPVFYYVLWKASYTGLGLALTTWRDYAADGA